VRVTSAGSEVIEVTTTKSVIVVKLVESSMNDAEMFDRENHATAIASFVSQQIFGQAEFKKISSLRIEFLKRTMNGASKVVDTIEYRENPVGVFRHHKT
jgi:hypothetical protein